MEKQFHNSTFIFPQNAQEDLNRLENGAGGETDKERTVKTAPYKPVLRSYSYSGGT